MASAQCQKSNATTEICQPKSHHSSFGQKISEMTSGAFKGHHGRQGSNQNQLQCYSQTQAESYNLHTSSQTQADTHCYSQTQTQHHKDHGVAKTEITICVVQAQITQTSGNDTPHHPTHGMTGTTCFGNRAKKNRELNNKKENNLFRRIKDGISRHGNDSTTTTSSSDSDSDNENCRRRKN